MKKFILVLFIGFLFGYFVSDVLETKIEPKADASVAGMDRYDLKYDYDFKGAVKDVITSDCKASYNGNISCY